MSFGNVIPIDAEVARQLARREVRFRWLVAGLVTLWLAVLVPTLLFTPLPPLVPFVALAVLVILAEHRFVLFGDETSMSASIIVVVASVFVFADTAPLSGPLLIGSIAGLYLPHLRTGATSLALANVSIFGLSAAIAAGLASGPLAGGNMDSTIEALAATVAVSAAYWYANSILTGFASALRLETQVIASVRNQVASEWPVLILTAGAGLLAMATASHISTVILGLTAVVVLFEIYVRQVNRHGGLSTPMASHAGALAIGACSATYSAGTINAAVAVIGSFVVIAGLGPLSGRSRTKAGIVLVAFVASSVLAFFDVNVAVRFVSTSALSLVALGVFEFEVRAAGIRAPLPRLVTFGYLLPGRVEFASVAAIAALLWLACEARSTSSQSLVALVVVAACARPMLGIRARHRAGQRVVSAPRSSAGASR